MLQQSNKSRSLTVLELFKVLQEEYIVCLIRVAIYPLQKHRDYWQFTADKKKEKILDIGKNNALLSIFDDKALFERFRSAIIPEWGFPKFFYKNDEQYLMQSKWDTHNYYLPEVSIKAMDEFGKEVSAVIVSVDFNEKQVIAKVEGVKENQVFNFEMVTREIVFK